MTSTTFSTVFERLVDPERPWPLLVDSEYGQAPQLVTYIIIGTAISVIPLIVALLSPQRFWRSGLRAGA